MAAYPVTFDIQQQEKYDRVHIAIRLVIVLILVILGGAVGWIYGLLFLAVPVAAAILISQKGAARYFAESEQSITLWLRWITAAYAYLFLLTDRLPNQNPKETLRFHVTPTGEPTAGGVLLRIILVIPHAIVLGLLALVSLVLMIVAAAVILVQEKYPEGIFAFLRGDMRWNARVFGYLAGLTQDYPPFAFDTGPEDDATPIAAGVTPPPPHSDADAGR